jgi:hypothetical protein
MAGYERATAFSTQSLDPAMSGCMTKIHWQRANAAVSRVASIIPTRRSPGRTRRVPGEIEDVCDRRNRRVAVPGPGVEVEEDVAGCEGEETGGEQVPRLREGWAIDARACDHGRCRRQADHVIEDRLGKAVPRQQEVKPGGCEARDEVDARERHGAEAGGFHVPL